MPSAASTGKRRSLPPRRTPPAKGWGQWIDARLTAKVMTQREAFDALRTRWPDLFPWSESSLDSFRAYIRGKTPDPQQEAAFIELFGGPGPNMATSGVDTTSPDVAALLEAVGQLVARIDRQDALIHELLSRVVPPPVDPIEERASVAFREAEEAAARERPQSTSRRRRSDPEHRPAEQRRASREGERA